MRRDDRSPEAYRGDVEGRLSEMLETVREVIFEVVPGVHEGIRHGMLDYPGLANLGAQKEHVALYVAPSVLARHKASFPGASAGKSCLRFKKPEQIDRQALERLLAEVKRHRAQGGAKYV